MSRAIQIEFDVKDDIHIHQIQNFAEELSLCLEAEPGWGSLPMEEADRASTLLHIRDVHARKLTRVIAFVTESA